MSKRSSFVKFTASASRAAGGFARLFHLRQLNSPPKLDTSSPSVSTQAGLAQKQVELLTQAFPDRTRLAVLFDALSGQVSAAEQTAKALNLQVQALRLENPPYDFDAAFASTAAGG